MAESTSSSSSSSSQPNTSSTTPPKSTQYIKASADDDALEPDALRGNEHLLKDLNIENEDETRRKKITPEEKK